MKNEIVTIEENVEMGMNDEYRTFDCGIAFDPSAPFIPDTVRTFRALADAKAYGRRLASSRGLEFICDYAQ